ncbi:MAG: hypothetical protein EBZ67_16945, partial [Chitinophagia bacterium]|nr:hypothetical protein [Chitinophagia bacterium]
SLYLHGRSVDRMRSARKIHNLSLAIVYVSSMELVKWKLTPDMIEEGSVYGNGVRIANHILGGARFSIRPDDGVLDPNCRAWNFDNLYVTDGSCMPTSGGANPTLTIQANAFRIGEHLAQNVL